MFIYIYIIIYFTIFTGHKILSPLVVILGAGRVEIKKSVMYLSCVQHAKWYAGQEDILKIFMPWIINQILSVNIDTNWVLNDKHYLTAFVFISHVLGVVWVQHCTHFLA